MNGMHGHGPHRMLRLIVLSVLLQGPMNGAEIMKELEQRLGWSPSPGSLYPVLAQLAAEGLIQKNDEGKYALTGSGKAYSGGPPLWMSSVPLALGTLDLIVEYLERERNEVSKHSDRVRKLAGRLLSLAEGSQ